MLTIRFQRVGRTNDPAFRIVVTEKRSKPKSGGIEILGSYHPKTKAATLKPERILYWLSKGAQPSDTVYNLLIRKGMMSGKKIHVARGSAKKAPEAVASKRAQESTVPPPGEPAESQAGLTPQS